ncbi:hypothetical protein V7798_33465 [Rhizobium laguerreae]
MKSSSFKSTVCFEQRPDGGLRVWSEDVSGLATTLKWPHRKWAFEAGRGEDIEPQTANGVG